MQAVSTVQLKLHKQCNLKGGEMQPFKLAPHKSQPGAGSVPSMHRFTVLDWRRGGLAHSDATHAAYDHICGDLSNLLAAVSFLERFQSFLPDKCHKPQNPSSHTVTQEPEPFQQDADTEAPSFRLLASLSCSLQPMLRSKTITTEKHLCPVRAQTDGKHSSK